MPRDVVVYRQIGKFQSDGEKTYFVVDGCSQPIPAFIAHAFQANSGTFYRVTIEEMESVEFARSSTDYLKPEVGGNG